MHTIYTSVFSSLKYRNTNIYNKIEGGIHIWHLVSRLFTAIILLFFIENVLFLMLLSIQTLHYLLHCLRLMIKVYTKLREIRKLGEFVVQESRNDEYPIVPNSRFFGNLIFCTVWHILFIHVSCLSTKKILK